MDTAMQELLWVLKTMPPEQVVAFMAELFVWLDESTQTMFVDQVWQLMGAWQAQQQATMQQESSPQQANLQWQPAVDISNIF